MALNGVPVVSKWKIQQKELINDLRLFKVLKQKSYHTQKRASHDFLVLNTRDWCNIVALTPGKNVVLIRQYRAGIDDIALELPGGVVELNEDPMDAALRELTEETGFVAKSSEYLGFAHPNPAIQNNRCHFILAFDCEKTAPTCFDPSEDIESEVVSLKKIPEFLTTHQITHSLVISAFHRLLLKYPELFK